MIVRFFCISIFFYVFSIACTSQKGDKSSPADSTSVKSKINNIRFTKLSPSDTGVSFSNQVRDSLQFNVLNYAFMYNGGGVAIGDINNDGLSDLFFTGNMVSSRLYLNKGDMQFEDITESAGVSTKGWITGTSMVDINGDGLLDIYLSVAGRESDPSQERANLLFVNNGDNSFTEKAKEYNIADTSFTTHAVFLDYNRDGLLDLYLLNHSPGSFSRDMGRSGGSKTLSTSFDILYKNNGNGTFSDVSRRAGILQKTGYGLGVAVADINRDGWPDIYISNDIAPDDVLYVNNKDGTFTDKSHGYLKHTSYAGMGVDIADFNNDEWPDILQVDMMPPDYQERKLMSYGVDFKQYNSKIRRGYNYSYTKNTLQMSNGVDQEGNILFSEVGRMAGVAFTGWSWAPLFGDYDNNGYKDILVTNGYPTAVNDFDYLVEQVQAPSATAEEEYQRVKNTRKLKLRNYLFGNDGGITFEDVSENWGFKDSTYSYGAAHGDLDNDGDLDIVISNLNATASIYQNNASELAGTHYLSLQLNGPQNNRQGIGATVVVNTGGNNQHKYVSPYRGYQSSVEPRIHFGLGAAKQVDSIEVFWPDGQYQLLTNVETNKQVTIDYKNAENNGKQLNPGRDNHKIFRDVTDNVGLRHQHQENTFNDYDIQPLLHRQLSRMGPKMAVGDVTGDGLEDVYIGGASGYPGTLYVQNNSGRFEAQNQNQPWLNDAYSEDMGAVIFDANGDGKQDIYVASGGYEFSPAEEAIQDRLYLNRGNGQFYKSESTLPQMLTSSSMVSAGDFNDDGQIDLFVCGRLTPLKYPDGARSYILQNEGGRFRDVTQQIAPELAQPSLRTDAEWIDFNGDGQLDLVTTGIWSRVQFYENGNGRFKEVTESVVEFPKRGWWYTLEKGDFNNDGVPDLVAGNMGLNHTFTTSEEQKLGLWANDFDNNYTRDLVYTVEENGAYYPFFGKAKLGWAIPPIDKKYPTYRSFSEVPMKDIFEDEALAEAKKYQVDTFASTLFLSGDDGKYRMQELPEEAQISPVKGMVVHDVDKDGLQDIVIAGNMFRIHPDISRADAGNGLWLKGAGNGTFNTVSPFQSGFVAPGDVKDLKLVNIPGGGTAVLLANNNTFVKVFSIIKE